MANNHIKKLFSIILAFRNEGDFLKKCLDSLDKQTLPRNEWEIILVDGESDDNSSEYAREYVDKFTNVKLLINENKIATSGWNIGLNEANGEYFCLAGGHSYYDKDYFSKAKRILTDHPEINALGGKVYKIGLDKLSNSIAECTNTYFAIGGSYYRIGEIPKKVKVIGAGIYEKKIVEKIGTFDESLKRSGDYEFNYRVTSNGYKMYFDPSLKIYFYSRANLKSLFMQQFRTGFWKIKIWAKHRGAILPRHLIPAFFILWLLAGIFILFLDRIYIIVWIIPILIYLILALIFSLKAMSKNTIWIFILLSYPILHISYGAGIVLGFFKWGRGFFNRK
jgi:glycosyltransferase involved in cell wall biosynthesis